jgi:hypothetical protein
MLASSSSWRDGVVGYETAIQRFEAWLTGHAPYLLAVAVLAGVTW